MRTWGAVLVVVLMFMLRELDLHKTLTGTSVLRASYYLEGSFGSEKAMALLHVAVFIVCIAYLCVRYYEFVFLRPESAAVPVFLGTLAAAKALDRSTSILAEDFDVEVSAASGLLVVALEEGWKRRCR